MTFDPIRLAAKLGAYFAERNEVWTAGHTRLCEIPAPAYGEGPRGEAMMAILREAGVSEVTRDEVGNVYGLCPGSRPGPRVAVSSHLDTVFGAEVDVTVRREGPILRAPGIGDDCSGLAMLPALACGFRELELELPGELWLVATVGEESVGNLRGSRKIAADGVSGHQLDAFITLDSSVPGQVVRFGTHSINHDLVLSGPGGHAWGDYGVVNPSLALARIVSGVSEYQVPPLPRTTLNCGILEAGFAPNAIPDRAHGHLNLRSEDGRELDRFDRYARRVIADVIERANSTRRCGPALGVEHQVTSREGGETPVGSPLVQAAIVASERRGWPVSQPVSSTDANAFMAREIDAICVYCGEGGGEHTLDEWYDSSTRPEALEALAETVMGWFERVRAAE